MTPEAAHSFDLLGEDPPLVLIDPEQQYVKEGVLKSNRASLTLVAGDSPERLPISWRRFLDGYNLASQALHTLMNSAGNVNTLAAAYSGADVVSLINSQFRDMAIEWLTADA